MAFSNAFYLQEIWHFDSDFSKVQFMLSQQNYSTFAHEFQGCRVWGQFVFRLLELTTTPTNLANQVKVGHALDQSHSVQCTDLRERTKTILSHGDRRGQIADFRDNFERNKWLYLHFKCALKTKTHFECVLWQWSSLCQLNLEPTQPNGLMGCKVPTDLMKISQRSHAHGFYYDIVKRLAPNRWQAFYLNQCLQQWLRPWGITRPQCNQIK